MWTKSKHTFYTQFFFCEKLWPLRGNAEKKKKHRMNFSVSTETTVRKRCHNITLYVQYTACLAVLHSPIFTPMFSMRHLGAEYDRQEQKSKRLYRRLFDVCVTVHHWYNNGNSQLDVTITHFIDNYNQLSKFPAIISPILRSTRLCLQLVV